MDRRIGNIMAAVPLFASCVLAQIPPHTIRATSTDSGILILDGKRRGENEGSVTEVPCNFAGHTTALRAASRAPKETDAWGGAYTTSLTFLSQGRALIWEGDVIVIRLSARCISSLSKDGAGVGRFVFSSESQPHEDLYRARSFAIPRTWEEVLFTFPAPKNLSHVVRIVLGLGMQAQTVEIAGIEVRNLGRQPQGQSMRDAGLIYEGMEDSAAWRRAALQRIEKIRKSDLEVRVTDAKGKPLVGAHVRVRLTKHEFLFGGVTSAMYLWGVLGENAQMSAEDKEKLKAVLRQNFNLGLNEWLTRWNKLHPSNPESARYLADAKTAFSWLRDNSMEADGGFPIWVWKNNTPQPVLAMIERGDKAAFMKECKDRIDLLGRQFPQVKIWRQVTELHGSRKEMQRFGPLPELVKEWFAYGKKVMPNSYLYIDDNDLIENGGNNREKLQWYAELIRESLKAGAPIDGIGFQGHHQSPTAPKRLLEILDQFAGIRNSIVISEFDFATKNEEMQGLYVRDFYIACFSHPAVRQITTFGTWDKVVWQPGSGMYREDWTIKPSGRAYQDLVLGQWRTDQALITNANGTCALRASRGEYDVIVSHGGKEYRETFSLSGKGGSVAVRVE